MASQQERMERMTDREINIAIAKACGWSQAAPRAGGRPSPILTAQGNELWHYDSRGNSYGPCCDWERALDHPSMPIPDYCNDLNAMHAVVLGMPMCDQFEMACVLLRMVTTSQDWSCCDSEHWSVAVNATARQRAEAFLRTLNLWKE